MSAVNSRMGTDVSVQFTGQLHDRMRGWQIPGECKIIETDEIPAGIVQELRSMGLFGLATAEEYGGPAMNISQYAIRVTLPGFHSSTMG